MSDPGTGKPRFSVARPWSRRNSWYEANARTIDGIERQGLAVPCPVCGRQVIRAEERYSSDVANLKVRFEDHFVERWRGHCPCGAELHIVCDYDLSAGDYFSRES
jgi:hypothetical protein